MDQTDAVAITLIGGLAATVIIVLIARRSERRRRHSAGKEPRLSLKIDTTKLPEC